jgi:hypothetical protein
LLPFLSTLYSTISLNYHFLDDNIIHLISCLLINLLFCCFCCF